MNIAVIGAGYVGLVTGACFAELGNHVACIDVNQQKIDDLNQGILPIYEPGLDEMVINNHKAGRLQFLTSLKALTMQPDVIFIAVGTPSDEDGSADIQYVLEAAKNIGDFIAAPCVIVDKSTVPVGMADLVCKTIQSRLQLRQVSTTFDVVSNPEFLREGAAIDDFMRPDRVIVGLDTDHAKKIMLDLYLPLLRSSERLYFMKVKDAELTKYAANAMLATRISFMNEMSVLCDRLGVDIENIRIGIGSDTRIGSAFLNAGCGYGGSCFPKDVRALIKMAEQNSVEPLILRAVEHRNAEQKMVLVDKLVRHYGNDLSGLTFALWGLAFKPGTDDMREASSLVLISEIIKRGGKVRAYDPAAMDVARELLPVASLSSGQVIFVTEQYEAVEAVDALLLVTEWKLFCYPDFSILKSKMRAPVIFDGRNQYDPSHVKNMGFFYEGIGRPSTQPTMSVIKDEVLAS